MRFSIFPKIGVVNSHLPKDTHIDCHPVHVIYMQSTSCKNARLDEAQDGIKLARRNINNLRCADDTILMAESKEELKSLLIESERGE